MSILNLSEAGKLFYGEVEVGLLMKGGDILYPLAYAPELVTATLVIGLAEVGETLTINTATWDAVPAVDLVQYRWQRRGPDNWENIVGEYGNSYEIQSADIGYTIRVQTQARNAVGSSPWTNSNITVEVVGAGQTVPYVPVVVQNTIVHGDAIVGETLTITTATWNAYPEETSIEYRWQKRITGSWQNIVGENGDTYTIIGDDIDYTIRVQTRAQNTAGWSVWTNSNQTDPVEPAEGGDDDLDFAVATLTVKDGWNGPSLTGTLPSDNGSYFLIEHNDPKHNYFSYNFSSGVYICALFGDVLKIPLSTGDLLFIVIGQQANSSQWVIPAVKMEYRFPRWEDRVQLIGRAILDWSSEEVNESSVLNTDDGPYFAEIWYEDGNSYLGLESIDGNTSDSDTGTYDVDLSELQVCNLMFDSFNGDVPLYGLVIMDRVPTQNERDQILAYLRATME